MEKYYDINKDNHSIRCKVYCNNMNTVEKVVLFGHGFGGHKDNAAAARFASQMTSKYKKTALVVFDWPCHGKDARKKINLQECEKYIDLVNEDSKERFGTEDIYVYATSFGGFLFLKYILENGNPYRKIALRCPALNFGNTFIKHMLTEDDIKKLEKGKEIQVGFDRKVKINKEFWEEVRECNLLTKDFIDYAEDILIIHGTKDEIVPFESSRDFADENIIEFIAVEGADHRFRDPAKLDQTSADIMAFFEL